MNNEENKTKEINNQTEATKELNKEADSYLAKFAKQLDLMDEQKKRFDKRLEQEKQSFDNAKAEFDYQEKFLSKQRQRLILLEQLKSLKEEMAKSMDREGESYTKQQEKMEQLQKSLGIQEGKQIDINSLIEKQRDLVEDLTDQADKYNDVTDSIAKKLGFGNSQLTKTVGKARELKDALFGANKEQERMSLMLSAATAFSPQMIIGSYIESLVGLALELNKAGASLAAATGRGKVFNGVIASATRQGRAMGVTYENAAESIKGFNKSLMGMSEVTDMAGMTKSSAQLSRLGVGADQVTKSLNILTTGGMAGTNEAAMSMLKNIAMAGTQFGISSAQMVGDFTTASSQLAVHGTRTEKVFLGLQQAARGSGTEIGDLLGMASKFDTFQSAADTTSKLNAILGTTLSATKMLHMEEDERVATLIDTVNAQKGGFEGMDRFTRKAVMQAAGITDAAKAQQIFSKSSKEYMSDQKKKIKLQENEAAVQKKFEQAVSATIPIQEKFSETLKMLAENDDFVNMIEKTLDGFASFVSFLASAQKHTYGLAVPLTLLVGSFGLMYLKSKMMANALKTVVEGVVKTSDAVPEVTENVKEASEEIPVMAENIGEGFSKAINKIGESMEKNKAGMLAFGQTMFLIGVGVGIAALGVAAIVYSFSKLEGDQIYAAAAAVAFFGLTMIGLAITLGYFAPVLTAAVGGLYAFGAAFLMIGAAMLIAGIGLAIVVNSLSTLGKEGNTIMSSLYGISSALVALSAAIASLAMTGFGMMVGVNPFASISNGIREIANELDALDDNKKILLTTTLDNLARITTGTSAGITAGQVMQMTNVSPVEVNNTVSPTINLQATLLIDGKPIKVIAQDVTLGLDN